ncbi:MAG: hypothetical protein ACK4NV_01710 [Pannonibacter sp.]
MTNLNAAKGRCLATARLLIRPQRAVLELGAAEDVLATTLRAVHHANRHGRPDDFIAVALPMMHRGRETMRPGTEVELIGSTASLAAFLTLEGMVMLKRRGMLVATDIMDAVAETGTQGAAYVRDRACEKHTPGWIARSRRRAERRGKPLGQPVEPRADDTRTLLLRHGHAVLHIREQIGLIAEGPLLVSTYGFSSAAAPAVLPVWTESMRELDNAA